MEDFKQGSDPIWGTPTNADLDHVVTAPDRYQDLRQWVRQGPIAPQGITANRWDAEIRKAQVQRIDMQTYEVDASAVAEAILARLMAGRALSSGKDHDRD